MSAPVSSALELRRKARIANASPAVEVDHVRKTFRIPHQQYHTFKERALHPLRSVTYDEMHALEDVHITVPSGEFLGIVGRNGSGKSTLLKCLAGIYRPDSGKVQVHGRLSPFIELGVGFNPDLTARDNVVINAVMMGLSRREAKRAFDEVIAFAELEEFVDLKLKNYSSGMAVRLGFATAIQVDADILLVDEVLAVGDAAFQQKCFEEFTSMRASGRTIIFVTHDMNAVERFCDRAMLLERGTVLRIDEPHQIAQAYNELNFGRLVHESVEEEGRYGDQTSCEILDAWFEVDGERVAQAPAGSAVTAAMRVRFLQPLEDPVFGFTLRNAIGHTIFASTNELAGSSSGSFAEGSTVVVRTEFEAWFATSQYRLTTSIARAGAGVDAIDLREDLASIVIHSTRSGGGILELPQRFTVEHL